MQDLSKQQSCEATINSDTFQVPPCILLLPWGYAERIWRLCNCNHFPAYIFPEKLLVHCYESLQATISSFVIMEL